MPELGQWEEMRKEQGSGWGVWRFGGVGGGFLILVKTEGLHRGFKQTHLTTVTSTTFHGAS